MLKTSTNYIPHPNIISVINQSLSCIQEVSKKPSDTDVEEIVADSDTPGDEVAPTPQSSEEVRIFLPPLPSWHLSNDK